MDANGIGGQVLWLTALILGGFGVVVAAVSVALRCRGRSPRPLLTKYAAWFIIAPVIVLPLVYSRMLFAAVVMLLSLQCIREFSRATGLWADRGMMRISYALAIGLYVPTLARWHGLHQAMPLIVISILLLVPILRGRYEHMLQKVSLSIFAVLYFGWFLSHLACARNLDGGIAYVFLLVVLVACFDGSAFLWGKWLGRHKLSSRISPNKTVEGAALAAASVIGVAFLMRGLLPEQAGLRILLLGIGIGVLALFGDLVVSFVKRDLSIKDMGSAIPGHGGLLDRCDSLILAAPVFFYVIRAFHAA